MPFPCQHVFDKATEPLVVAGTGISIQVCFHAVHRTSVGSIPGTDSFLSSVSIEPIAGTSRKHITEYLSNWQFLSSKSDTLGGIETPMHWQSVGRDL